jgi:nucleoside-diphosphate-sugar epimerase
MRNVLVTGGAGYKGCVLVPKLLAAGFGVTVLDIMYFGDDGLAGVKGNPRLKIISGDIRSEDDRARALACIDSVISLAAISNDPSADLDPKLTWEVNFDGVTALAREAKRAGVTRFINVSSSSVYGVKDVPNVTEDMALDPLTDYSKTKAEAEVVIKELNGPGFTTVNLRPATVCGWSPRLRLDLTVNILTAHALMNGKIIVFGGVQKRPNVHIDDITEYYVKFLDLPAEKIAGKCFNAGYENHSVMQIAQMVKDVVGKDVAIEVKPTDDIRSYHISSAKIKNELGLAPKRTILDAVKDLVAAFNAGKVRDWQDMQYYNVKKMKALQVA